MAPMNPMRFDENKDFVLFVAADHAVRTLRVRYLEPGDRDGRLLVLAEGKEKPKGEASRTRGAAEGGRTEVRPNRESSPIKLESGVALWARIDEPKPPSGQKHVASWRLV